MMRQAYAPMLTAVSLAASLLLAPAAPLWAQSASPPPRRSPPGVTPAGTPAGAPPVPAPAPVNPAPPDATGPLTFPPRLDYHTRAVRVRYDKFADTTTLTAVLSLTGVWEALVRPIVNMDLQALHEGRVPVTPPATVHVVVHVSNWAADAAHAVADSARLSSTLLVFVVDDSDRVRLPVVPTVGEKFRNDSTGMRMVLVDEAADVPIATFLRLANARKVVDAKAGQVVFSIKGDELNALRDFASRLGPGH